MGWVVIRGWALIRINTVSSDDPQFKILMHSPVPLQITRSINLKKEIKFLLKRFFTTV